MNKRAFARSEKEKSEEFELSIVNICAWTVRLCLPRQWPVIAIYKPKRKRSTCVVLCGCALFPESILELVDFCFLSDFRIEQRYSICNFPYLLPLIDAMASAVVYVEFNRWLRVCVYGLITFTQQIGRINRVWLPILHEVS